MKGNKVFRSANLNSKRQGGGSVKKFVNGLNVSMSLKTIYHLYFSHLRGLTSKIFGSDVRSKTSSSH